jgi:ribonuclease HI
LEGYKKRSLFSPEYYLFYSKGDGDKRRGEAESSNNEGTSMVWKQIWKLKLPNVDKKNLWRACHEILPTRVNLKRRKIVEDSTCPLCGLEDETVLHVMWQCPSAADVWSMGCRKLQKWSFEGRVFLQLAEKVFNNCETEEIQLFVGTARLLWLRRNDVVFGKMLQHPTEVAKRAKRHVEEFLQASENRNMDAPSVAAQRDRRWRAPEEGWLKANWDASSARSQDRLGFGVVVRTENGTVVAAQSKTLEGTLDPTIAEAHAALLAIQLCRERGFTKVHFEGDTQIVVNAVNSNGVDWNVMGLMINDIRREMETIQSWRMTFANMEGNNAAHFFIQICFKQFYEQTVVL